MEKQDITYIEDQIQSTYRTIQKTHYEHIMDEYNDYEEENPGYRKFWIIERLQDFYYLVLTYLEAKKMPILCTSFQSEFYTKINDNSELMKDEMFDPEGQPELVLLIKIRRYLEPFKLFDYTYEQKNEVQKVKDIISETPFILANSRAHIVGEADIYKEIKWVLGLYYPKTRKLNKARFIEAYNNYHPDILIPELKLAIEYKYIKSNKQNVGEYIDQLKTDSTVYVNDEMYKEFIAAIHISDSSITTRAIVETAWKERKFPENWHLVVTINDTK